jgi:hypothetical protein
MTSLISRRGKSYIGPLPDEPIVSGRLAFRKIPSEAWYAAHPDGEATEPPGDADMVVQSVLLGSLSYPSRLKHPQEWDTGQFPVVELAVTPYLDWKAAADADIARKKGGGPSEADDAPEPAAEPGGDDSQPEAS